jgi:phosphoribosyl-ATP pyrophosphohydrolase
LADAFAAPLVSDRADGLWPTVVVDEDDVALGLAYSSRESLRAAIDTRQGVYHSRQRGLWIKGETSGATQQLLSVAADCDRDAIRFRVRQSGVGFCHRNARSCWGDAAGVPELARHLQSRLVAAPAGSYTRRLLDDPNLLHSKLVEEAIELSEAKTSEQVIGEAADVLYFTIVKLVASGVEWSQVASELDRRRAKVTRRPGDSKTKS